MCKFIHHYGWGVGASFFTHQEAKRKLYQKRVDFRKMAAEDTRIVILRDEPNVLTWRHLTSGEDHTVSIMRQPTGVCCRPGESFDPETPYVPVQSGDMTFGSDRERVARMDAAATR